MTQATHNRSDRAPGWTRSRATSGSPRADRAIASSAPRRRARLSLASTLLLFGVQLVVFLGFVLNPQLAGAVDLPPLTAGLFLQTSGPSAGLNIGDWYTTPVAGGGGGTTHQYAIDVPSGWPAGTPITVALFDPESSEVGTAHSPEAVDEVRSGVNDRTTFTLRSPGGSVLQTTTFTTSATDGQWYQLYTFSPGVSGYGTYTLETTTGDGNVSGVAANDDDNSWRLNVNHDPDCTTGTTGLCVGLVDGDEVDNFDGLPGTGDELTAGINRGSFQHAGTTSVCNTYFFIVEPSTPRAGPTGGILAHNFDMDGSGSVVYTDPDGGTYGGTVSGNATWNNSGTSARVGDELPAIDGWWRAEVCLNANNQYVFEGPSGSTSYLETQPPAPRIELVKDDGGLTAVNRGDTITYTIDFANTSDTTPSPGQAVSLTIVDAIPAGSSYVGGSCLIGASVSGSCSYGAGEVTFVIADTINPGATGQVFFQVTVDPNASGTIENTATATFNDILGNDYVAASNTDINTVRGADLAVTKVVDQPNVVQGATVTFTVTVSNLGTADATNVVLSDLLPSGLTYVSSTVSGGSYNPGTGGWTVGGLLNGSSKTLVIVADVIGSGTLTNTATVTGLDQADPNPANDSASAAVNVTVPPLTVVKTSNPSGSVSAGSTINYTVSITNSGTTNQTGITIDDLLPPEVTYVAQSTVAVGTRSNVSTVNKTVRDEFATASYANNNGTNNWAGNWIESGETTSPTAGRVTITSGQLRFANLDSVSISRGVNLSSPAIQSAVLTFSYSATSIGNETLAAQLWNGSSWNTVASISGGTGTVTHPLTAAQRSAGTSLRFLSASGNWSGGENASVDNVQIAWVEQSGTYSVVTLDNVPGGVNPDLVQGNPTTGNLVVAGDGLVLRPGESMTVAYRAIVAPTLSGSATRIVNTATVTSNEQPVAAPSTNRIPIDFRPVLSVVKSGPATAAVGELVTYSFVVSHGAGSDGSPVSSLLVSDDVAGVGSYVSGDDGDGLLELGESWVYSASYTVLGSDPKPLVNTVTVTGTDGDGQAVGPVSDSHSLVTDFAPVLGVVKSGPASALVGELVSYSFVVSHGVGSDGSGVSSVSVVDDVAGPGVSVDVSPADGFNDGDTDLDGLLDGGESWTFTASRTVLASDPDPLVNTVTVSGLDGDGSPVSASDSHSVDVDYQPVLAVSKSGLGTAAVGQTVTYTFTVTHGAGSDGSPVSGVAVSDDVAVGEAYVSGDDGDNLLEAGETWTFTATHMVAVGNPNPLVNTVTVTGLDRDGDPVVASDSHSVDIDFAPVLAVTKSGPATATVGETVTYSFVVFHGSGSDLSPVSAVSVTDDLAGAGTSVDVSPADGFNDGDTDLDGLLDSSETWTFTASYTVLESDPNLLTNTVTASGNDLGGSPVPSAQDAHTTDVVFAPVLAVVKSGPATAVVGQTVNYTFDVSHDALLSDGSPLVLLTVTDDVAGVATYVSGDDGDGRVELGETWTFTAAYTIKASDANLLTNTATAQAADRDGDTITTTGTHTTDIEFAPLLAVVKSGPATALVGDSVTYTFGVSHKAGSDGSPVSAVLVVDDVAGAGTSVDVSPVDGFNDGDTNLNGLLEAGESWTYSAAYTVLVSDPDPLNNTVTVTGDDGDSDPIPAATDTHSLNVDFAPALTVVKSGPASALVGESVTYTFTVTNDTVNGDGSPVTAVSVVDDVAGAGTYVSGDTNLNGRLETGESWVFEASYTVLVSDPDPLNNTVTVTGTDPDGQPATPDTDTHSLNIDFAPALAVVKTGPAAALVGDTITYTFTVTNDTIAGDGSPVSAVSVSDDVAGAGTSVDVSPTDGFNDGDTNLNGLLETGETWIYEASYTVLASDPDPLNNTATVTGTDPDGQPITPTTDSHSLDIDYAPALAVVKTGPASALVGELVTYTFTVTNDTPAGDGSPISAVSVTDDVAGAGSYVSGDDGDNLLESGETWVYEAAHTVLVSDPDPLDNMVTVTGTDSDGQAATPDTDTHSLDIDFAPVLAVVKSGPTTALVGESVTYTFTVTNDTVAGDGSPVSALLVSDDVAGPAISLDVSPIDGFNDGDTNLNGLLEPGESWVYSASYTVLGSDPDPLSNTVTVTGTDPDGQPVTPVTDGHGLDIDFVPALAVVKTGPASALVGELVSYSFVVSHGVGSDGSPVSSVSVVDDVAGPGVSVDVSPADGFNDGDTDLDGLLDGGESWTFTASRTVLASDPDPLVNTVTVSGLDGDGSPVSASDSHSVDVDYQPVLAVSKSGLGTAAVGQTVTYTFTVTHGAGSDGSPVSGVAVSDDVAVGEAYVSGDDGDNLLEAGETWTFTATHMVAVGNPNPLVNTVTVTGLDRDGDPVVASDSHSVDIDFAPVLAVTKSGPATATVGETVTYSFVVFHGSGSDLSPVSAVSVTDDLAGAGTSVDVSPADGFNDGDTDLDGLLDSSETWTFTASYTVLESDPNLLTNTVTASGNDLGGSPVPSAQDAHTTDVVFAPVLAVVKSGPATAVVGQTVNYTFDVSHDALLSDGSPLVLLTVTDDVAGVATYVSGDDGDGRVELGETWTFTAAYTIKASDANLLTNTATAQAADRDGDTITTTGTHTTDIEFAPLLAVVKSGPATALVGDSVTYTFGVSHKAGSDGSPVSAVLVVDDVAGAGTSVDVSPVDGFNDGDTNLNGLLEAGESWTYSAAYTVLVSDPDPLNNTVTVTGDDGDSDPIPAATDTHSLNVDFAPALTVVKSGPASALVGESVTYTFTVTNDTVNGDGSPVTAVSVVDDVAGAGTYVSGDTNLNGRLETGESWVFEASYTVLVSDPDPLNNTVTVTGTDPDGQPATPDTDTHSLNIDFAPALAVVKTGPAAALVGDTITYTFTVTNDTIAGDGSPVSAVSVSDDVAGAGTSVDVSPTDGFNDGDTNLNGLLETGETWIYEASYTVLASDPDPLNNTATVTGTDPDGQPITPTTDSHSLDIDYAPALAVVKTGPASALVGELVTYTFTVTNDTPAGDGSPVGAVDVADPFGVPVYVDGDTNVDGFLDQGETWTYSMTYTIGVTDPDPLVNTAEADGVDLDGDDVGPVSDTHSIAVIPSGTVTEVVYDDVDGDGLYTSGVDSPLVGVSVTFTDVNGASQTIPTDLNGEASLLVEVGSTTIDVVDATLPPGAALVGGTDPTTVFATAGTETVDPTGYAFAGSVGDFVWDDLNGDGIQDIGEPGIAGVTVNLYDSAGTSLVATTTTDLTGAYSFVGLSPNDYVLDFDLTTNTAGSSFVFTLQDQPADDTLDSDVDPLTGRVAITVAAGVGDSSVDAGAYSPITISDFVWVDSDGDGIQAGTESGLDGVVVELLDGVGTVISSTTTSGGGIYSFGNLIPGDYELRFVEPLGYFITFANLGGDDALDSDADQVTGETGVVTYLSGDSTGDIDAGMYVAASIGDFVWEDLNGNGLQDDGASGIAGVTVTATYYGPDGVFGTGDDATLVTTTDVDGLYLFDNLAPGTYDIVVSDPVGSTATTPTTFTAISVTSGSNYLTADSGYYYPTDLGDFVWVDLDGDGIQDVGEPGLAGVTVTLVGTDGLGNAVSLSDVTDASGAYGFANLAPGTYTLGVDGAGWTFTLQDIGGDATDSDVSATGTVAVTVVSGSDDLTVDAGVLPITIGDYVWIDGNGNGLQDSGELPLGGVVVNLRDASTDALVATATSAADGSYSLAAAPGNYVVEFVAPAGYEYTESNVGADDGSDSDASQLGGRTGTITVADSSDSTISVDAGFYELATISDYVWIDADGDGLQGGTEVGLDGVTVTLNGVDGAGNVISLSDTTAGGGLYGFDVPPGTYTVTFDLSTAGGSYVLTVPNAGDDAIDSDAGSVGDPSGSAPAVTVASGDVNSTVDAGAYEGATIAGSVFEDVFAEGTQDPADVALQGIGVTLLDGLGNVVANTTTDIDGDYTFVVPPGDYQVVIDTTGYLVSPQDAAADSIDSDIDLAGATSIFMAASGAGFDFDGLLYRQATISDLVFVDLDADGIHDVAEPGLAGVTVSLFADADQDGNPDGPALDSTITDANGLYGFTTDPGHYVLTVDGSGFTFTTPNVGANDTLDSDVDASGTTGTVTVVSGEVDDSVDAGVLPALLSDFVWNDLNADGIQDVGEPGIQNVTVNLWADTTGNGTPDTVIATDLTDVNGIYQLAAGPGTYFIEFDYATAVGSWVSSPADQGADDALDSDADPVTGETAVFVLVDGSSDDTLDAGAYLGATVSDFVWDDLDGDGVQDGGEPGLAGVIVNLVSDPGIDGLFGTPDDVVVTTDTTDVNGQYALTATPGEYTVVFLAPSGMVFTIADQGSDLLDSDALVTADPTVAIAATTLSSGEVDVTVDAGLFTPIVLSDLVWYDIDGDGGFDTGEPGLASITVTLFASDGTTVLETTTTDVDGSYSFAVVPGDYVVAVATGTLPTGMTATYDLDAGLDSTTALTAISGTDNPDVDFGYTGTGSIGDAVLEDTNGDGTLGVAETAGLSGATVELTWVGPDGTAGTGDDVTYPTQTTGPTGAYDFTLLPAGQYSVDVIAEPVGYILTTANDPLTVNLAAGQDFNAADFGFTALATVSDFVWTDTNGDGIQDVGEPGIDGVTVNLVSDPGTDSLFGTGDDVVADTTTTGALGAYSLTALPGDYTVVFFAPPTTSFSPANQGGDDTVDSDALVTADPGIAATPITLTSGLVDDTVDAGLFANATVSDFVWEDTNGNGLQDDGATGVGGVTVTLVSDAGLDGLFGTLDDVIVDSTVTDANGAYVLSAAPGSYTVVFDTSTAATAFRFTTANAGGDDTVDSDPVPTVDIQIGTVAIVLGSGQADSTVDAGLVEAAVISDLVYHDVDGDGIYTSGTDIPLVGVTVTLTRPDTSTTTAITDTSGNYSFTVDPGTYDVTVDTATLPAGMVITEDPDGGADDTATLTVASGEVNTTTDFGYTGTGSIGDLVFEDTDGDGVYTGGTDIPLDGVPVTATWAGPDGVTGNSDDVAYTATTSGGGLYNLALLPAGEYTIDADATATGLTAPVPTTGDPQIYVLAASEAYAGADFGYYEPATLTGLVWSDLDANGIQNGEPFVESVSVELWQDTTGNGVADTQIATVATDATGTYTFSNVAPGDYAVIVDGVGFTFTAQDSGADDTIDSDVDASGASPVISVNSGDVIDGPDAGYLPATIGNRVWDDLDGDGIQDPGEPGVEGVVVNLYDASDLVTPISTTLTSGGGLYGFAVAPGAYVVEFVAPGGTAFAAPNQGGDLTLDSDASQTTGRTGVIGITDGTGTFDIDAGLVVPATIGDTVFSDLDGDGVLDPGEPGLPTVTVNLVDSFGTTIDTVATNGSGNYLFTNVAPGSYTVTVDGSTVPAGYVATTTDPLAVIVLSGDSITTADFGWVPPSSMTVVKDPATQNVVSGGDADFTITITNTGGTTLTNLVVDDPLATCTPTMIGSLVAGAQTVVSCTTSGVTADFTNSVTVTADSPAGVLAVSDTANVVVLDSSILVTKSPASQDVVSGGTATFTISVTNDGETDLTNVVIDDPLASCASTTLAGLVVGESVDIVCTTPNVTASYTNTVTVTADDPLLTEVTSTDSADVVVLTPAFSVAKNPATQTVALNGDAVFNVSIANTGQTALTNITITDSQAVCDVTSIASLAIGASQDITCTTTGVTADFTNIVDVTAEDPLGAVLFGSDSADVTVLVPGVSITKDPAVQYVVLGGTATFNITVTNTGALDLTNVGVADALAPGCDNFFALIPVGGTDTYSCTQSPVTGDYLNQADVEATDTAGNPVSDTDTASVDMIQPAIDIQKSPDPTYARAGDTVTFTIDVTNVGDVGLTNVVVSDPLTASCDNTFASLAVGGTESYTCTMTAAADFTNVIGVVADEPSGGTVTAGDSADLDVIAPGILVTKSPATQEVIVNGDATFTVSVENTGDSALTNVVISDPLAPACDATFPTLAAGETQSYACVLSGVTAGFTNTVSASADDLSGQTVTSTDSAAVTVVSGAIDIQKTPNLQTILSGDPATFGITVTNGGTIDLFNVAVSDPLVPACDNIIGTLTAGSSVSYGCVLGAVPDDFTNTATVTSQDAVGNPVTDSDVADVDVILPAISVSKTPDIQTVTYNGTATFTMAVTNDGDADLTNVVVSDPNVTSCDSTIATLVIGETVSYSCTLANVVAGFTNTVNVVADEPSGGTVTATDTADTTVLVPAIEIQKSPDYQIVGLGGTVDFTITVTNTGQTDLFNVAVTDALTPSCDASIGTMLIGASTSYACTSDPVAADFTNTANVTSTDALGGVWADSDAADIDLVDPGLEISKTPNLQTLLSGETATFDITVTNTGDVDLPNVAVSDPLAPDCDNPIGLLTAGSSLTYTCTLLNVTADFTNTATVTSDNPLGGTITVSDTADVDVVFPGVEIQKTPDPEQVVVIGDLATFTIAVTNTGDQDLTGLMVSDPLVPACDSGPFDLLVGGNSSYICTVTVTGDFTNIASVAGTDALGNPVSDSDDASVDAIDPSISISNTPDAQTVIYDGTATFTIEVTNTGDVDLVNVIVSDPNAPNCATSIASLAVGETVTYTCTLDNVTADLTNTATVTSTDPLGNAVTDSDGADVTVLVPGVEIQKTPDFQQVSVGSTATFTITLTNTGETVLADLVVADPLVASCGRIVSSLAIGATTSYSCTSTVAADFTNTASVTADDPLGNSWTDSDTADVDAIAPGLAVTKSPDVQSVPLGDDATFVIEVTNTGDVDLTDVSLVDASVPACDSTIASLLVGESVSYNCVVTVTGDFTNTIVASGLDPNLDPVDGGNDTADVTALLPGVLVEKVASPTAIGIGQDATFTITVTNTGDVTLATVDVVDAAYPACDNTVGPLAPNASASYVCTVTDVLVGFTNTVDASALDGNGNPATSSDSESITVLPASITITKVADAPSVVDGGDITYTITVDNDGPADVVAVSVTDPTLPACDNAFAALAAGASQTYTCVLAGVDAATADPLVNTISVTAQDEAGNAVSDSDSEVVDVLVPELSIFKTADTPTVLENGTATFTVTVINTGETVLDTVTITDVGYPACDGAYPTLAIGEVQSYSCDVVGVTADFTNTVTASAVDPIGGAVTATDSASVTVIQTGDLGGFVFTDENGDGVFNPADGDAPIADVDVVLTGPSGPPATVVTDGSGLYSATLPVGDYSVDVDETDVDFPVGYGNETTGTDGQTVTVDDTVPVTAADIGYAPAGDIVGTVWEDANGDGLQDLGEAGRPGVAVNLWVDTDSNGSPDTVVASTTTDANGDYFFIGIADGTYAVEVIASDISPMDIGGDDSIDSDIDPVTGLSGPLSVLPGAEVDLDAGVYVPASVGDLVYIDLNRDGARDGGEPGFSGIVVSATNSSSGTVFTTTSDSTGAYSFSLPPGNYDIAVVEPAGTSVTTANDPTNLSLVSGDVVDTVDFGIDAVGSIAGRVMLDVNGDGTDSGSEPPLSGITVVATWGGPDGTLGTGDDVAYTTTTDPAGDYQFGNVPAGDYEIAVSQPAGTVWSFDPDPTADGIDFVTLLAGQSVVGEDFGVAGAASLSTRVYFDIDGDGIADAGEPGIEGVEVTVVWDGPDGVAGNADDVAYVVFTDADGDLTVSYLMPGNHAVSLNSGTLPPGLTQTDDPDATVDGATSLTVNPAQAATAGVFGYTGTGAIGDTVFIDFDGDGIQDAGEPGVPGVAVVVTWAGQDGIAGTGDDVEYVQVTDAGGRYLVPGLAAGSYVVALDPTTLPPGLGGAIPIAVSLAGGQIYLDADFGLGGNLPPIAIDDSAVTLEDEPVTIVVLGNDGDPEGHTVLVTAVTQPANGSVSINADGTVTYVPDPDFSGVDTFTYTICEDTSAPTTGIAPTGECATATVTVTVSDVNDPPVNTGDTVITVTVGRSLPPLSFTEPEGSEIVFILIGGSLPPGVVMNADGTFTGTTQTVGTYTFVVRVCDPEGACTVVTFSVVVQPTPSTTSGSGTEPILPYTGYNSMSQVVLALTLILGGLVLLAVSRRRPEERANGEG